MTSITPFAIDPAALKDTLTAALGPLAKRVDLALDDLRSADRRSEVSARVNSPVVVPRGNTSPFAGVAGDGSGNDAARCDCGLAAKHLIVSAS